MSNIKALHEFNPVKADKVINDAVDGILSHLKASYRTDARRYELTYTFRSDVIGWYNREGLKRVMLFNAEAFVWNHVMSVLPANLSDATVTEIKNIVLRCKATLLEQHVVLGG